MFDLEDNNPLLPAPQSDNEGSIYGQELNCPNGRQVWRICTNLKLLIDKVVPILFDKEEILRPDSSILNDNVIELCYTAAGGKGDGEEGTSSRKYRACLVFCLLKVCDWYWQQSEFELSDNELYSLRALSAQTLAAIIIEREHDEKYLFLSMLCHRYTICLNGEDAERVSALELAVDMHSTTVISSSGYQRCIKWLWRGWIVQSSSDPHSYVLYKGVSSHSIRTHFDPARLKTPLYQNILEVFFSFVYLVLYSIILNTNSKEYSNLNIFEVFFYLCTLGSVLDECVKFYHVGWNYLGFWNAFNDSMHTIITISIGFRFASINAHGDLRDRYDEISYRLLSCAAPFMWSRLLLFLDAEKFVGAMMVVLKVMMKESILFFVLLGVVIIGFLQGFLGLDASDGESDATMKILRSLFKGVIGDSSFDEMGKLVPPYASVLYYVYTFLLSVILMNILIALYSTAYAAVVDNANDEYLALLAQKTLRYVRAPDTNIYVPPLNLIEIAITPISWVTTKKTFRVVNYYVMLVMYAPLLLYITSVELAAARRITYNRYKHLPDDANEHDTEWDLTDGFGDAGDGNDSSQLHNTPLDGVRARTSEINDELSAQRASEREDNEFMINLNEFEKKVEAVAKPVKEATKVGLNWQFYDLYKKIDKLTEMVELVITENKELKGKLGGSSSK